MGAVVGIDLGTTFSAIAHLRDGVPEVIMNDLGKAITPSVVDLGSDPPVVGEPAKEKQSFGDDSVYSFFKRDMGNPNAIYVERGRQYTAVDLSAIVLKYLKECAENVLQQPVTDAVITVPAYFNDLQRRDTIEAGRRAGLNVLRIISEPTSAALAFGLRPSTRTVRILVYDLGGGTFDVSLVESTPSEMRVIGTAGDHYLGGKDWDDRILQYLSTQFENEFGVELIGDEFNDLMVKAETVKKDLSVRANTRVSVQAKGKSSTYEVSREQFEHLTQDLMQRTQMLVDQVLQEAHLTWADIEGALLIGGSTRMPMVREYVEHMSGKAAMTGVNPDEAVALGAAVQAAIDMAEKQGASPTLMIGGKQVSSVVDVISNSLGLIAESEDRSRYLNSLIIQKNKPIPCEETRPYQIRVRRRSEENKLEVFMTQGETNDPMTCAYLGMYVFTGIPAVTGKVAVIDISYAYNRNGVVEVSAVERSTKTPLHLSIEPLPADVPARFKLPPAQAIEREHLNLYMAFDLSGSMSGTPLSEAKQAAHKFLQECDLTTTSIGIIEFSDSTMVTHTADQNARKIAYAIDDMSIGRTGGGNSTDPFNDIYHRLDNAKGLRYAIVLTDGVWSHQENAIKLAKRCHAAGIEIIAIGFGGADRDFLEKISSSTEYSFFTNLNDLSETFSNIAQELTESGGEMSPERMGTRRKGLGWFG